MATDRAEYICRTWKQIHGEWTSGFDSFPTREEAEQHGATFCLLINEGEDVREFEVYQAQEGANKEKIMSAFYGTNGVICKRDEFELGNYHVVRTTRTTATNVITKDYNVWSDKNYMPTIEYDEGWWKDEKPSFKIQTTAYGALDIETIKEVVNGYNEAIEAVEILTMNFC